MRTKLNLEVPSSGSLPYLHFVIQKSYLIVLVLFAGLMSGLTVGMLSIDKMDLEIKSIIGTEAEKR